MGHAARDYGPPAPTDKELYGLPRHEPLYLSVYVTDGDPSECAEWARDKIIEALNAGDGECQALLEILE